MSEAQHTMPTRAKTTRTRHVSRRIKEAKIKPTARKTKGVALMKIPYADAIGVATEDVLGWFEACETERDCGKRPSRPLRPRDNLDSSEPRGIARTVPA